MIERREFPRLRQRRTYLEQELYTYTKYLNSDQVDPKVQTKQALDAERNAEELVELEYALRYFERLGNGYHLTQRQWLLLLSLVVVAVALLVVMVVR